MRPPPSETCLVRLVFFPDQRTSFQNHLGGELQFCWAAEQGAARLAASREFYLSYFDPEQDRPQPPALTGEAEAALRSLLHQLSAAGWVQLATGFAGTMKMQVILGRSGSE